MAAFIKVTPTNTGRQHAIAVCTIARVEPIRDPAAPSAKSLVIFNSGARALVTENIDAIAASARAWNIERSARGMIWSRDSIS
jgi:hypothetical protein